MLNYLGEIRIFAGTRAPTGWAFCDGRKMSMSANTALFALLGGAWGTDGSTYFQLPDLRGRLMVGVGSGPGLTKRALGEMDGGETVTLRTDQLPVHNHGFNAGTGVATDVTPGPTMTYAVMDTGRPQPGVGYVTSANPPSTATPMHPLALQGSGSTQAHDNLMPAVALNYIIATTGIWPT